MMKKLSAILAISILSMTAAYSQYFQGTFTNSGNTLIFKMKPTADLTRSIAYLEFCFRYETATTPAFTISNLVNGAQFPGLNLQRRTDYVSGPYTYVRYLHNTSTIPSFTYQAGVEYEIGRLNLIGTGVGDFEMASDLVDPTNETVFGIVDGAGNLIDPGPGAHLYGPGFNVVGNLNLLPLAAVPIPVRFTGFSATKTGNDAILRWSVENEDASTDRYELERSLNGVDFTKFATVLKNNSGNSSQSYLSADGAVAARVSNTFAIVYYRIKQVDRDGRFVYTDIKNVRFGNIKGTGITVFPNPVIDKATLNVDLEKAAQIFVIITDASGKEVQKMNLQGNKGLNINTLDMKNLSAGSYLVKVTVDSEVQTLSIVKSR